MSMTRHEYIDFCMRANGTTLTAMSKAEFDNVNLAILKWVNGTEKSRDLVYNRKASVFFWTSSLYDSQVWNL